MKKKTTRSKRERFAAFAEAYLDASNSTTYLNAYQAAIAAGYSAPYARGNSYKLVDNGGVRAEIERIKAEKKGNPNIATADEVLEALTTQLRVLPNMLFDPETKELISPADMDNRQASAVAGYKVKRRVIPGHGEDAEPEVETTYEYRLVDRQEAAELLGKYYGVFDKDNRQKAPTAPQALVAFPTQAMTLEEWQAQAKIILADQTAEKASCA
jgi:phage terminase small subunit